MRVTRLLKNSFAAGVVLVLPLAITLFIFRIVFNWAVGFVDPLVRGAGVARYTANIEFAAQVATIALILVAVTMLGAVVQTEPGRRLLGRIGQFVDFVPLFGTIYGSVRQVANSFGGRSDAYESVAFVEYPREGTYFIGFVTGEAPDGVAELAGKRAYNVYLPASPNPTTGNLALVPEDRVHDSDLSVRQGIRLLMTTGTATTEEELEQFQKGDRSVDVPEEFGEE